MAANGAAQAELTSRYVAHASPLGPVFNSYSGFGLWLDSGDPPPDKTRQ